MAFLEPVMIRSSEHLRNEVSRQHGSAADFHAAALNAEYDGADTSLILRAMIGEVFTGQITMVSSFGTESAILLSLVAEIDPALPVLFIDTGKLFPETIAYRDILVERLGLCAVRIVRPAAPSLKTADPYGALWMSDTDGCCALRKVAPLETALSPFRAWISGRKRFQGETRERLPIFEADAGRIKINPLAGWSKQEIADYAARENLPAHPLLAKGYRSVGCAPCTQKTPEGADDRAGRWAGQDKTECGIHLSHFRGAGI